jgi:hypothetical protein
MRKKYLGLLQECSQRLGIDIGKVKAVLTGYSIYKIAQGHLQGLRSLSRISGKSSPTLA